MGGGIQHLKGCGFLPVLCTLKCVESDGERRGELVRVERRQLAEHEREFCSQRELKCEFCGGAVRTFEMNPHLGECEEFPVDCPNGCEAAGETGTRQMKRGTVPLHLSECPLQRVKCPYREYGCGEEMERRQLAEHEREFCSQRELKCEFCGGAVRACEMNPHLGECEEFPVDCPNGCEAAGETGIGQVKRGAMPLHLAECPHQRVECPYREYGCGEEMDRRQLELHEREYMHTHFRLAMKEMKRKQMESNDKMKLLENENTELKETQIFKANNKINCLEKLSAVKDSEIISINKEINELRALSFESNEKINRLEKSSVDKDLEIISAKEQIEELKALSNGKIELLEKQDTRLKNEIKELKEITSTLASTGQLEWKIKGLKQKIEKKGNSFTDPFYVGLYKCQGYIEWDFNNTGKVACFICIMKGEFDYKLKWPFIYRFKFVLSNQNRNEDNHIWSDEVTKLDLQKLPECFQKPKEISNQGYGTSSFISNTGILTEKYCKEDSISLLITVQQLPTF